jgi:hypothetical protein
MGILRIQLAGRLKPSFVSYALQNVDTSDLNHALDRRIQYIAATMMTGKCSLCLPEMQP